MSSFSDETNYETTPETTMTTSATILPYDSIADQAFGPIAEEPLHDIDLTDLTVQLVEPATYELPEDRGHFQSPRVLQPGKLVRSTNELPPSFFVRPPFPKRSIAESPPRFSPPRYSTMSYGFYDSPDDSDPLKDLQLPPTMMRTETVSFPPFSPFPPNATGFQTPDSYTPPSTPPPLKTKLPSCLY